MIGDKTLEKGSEMLTAIRPPVPATPAISVLGNFHQKKANP